MIPINHLHLEDNINNKSGISEAEFEAVIDGFKTHYEPIVESHGETLNVIANWESSTVNAYADQSEGTWDLQFFGGLARRPEVSIEAFTIVGCHELGHHLAGFPFHQRFDWAASEGQADYFATLSCARTLWGDSIEKNREFRDEVDPTAKSKCNEVWDSQDDKDLCFRVSVGIADITALLKHITGSDVTISFDTPEDDPVESTIIRGYPSLQCRLDTFFQGALCDVKFDQSVIPGKEFGTDRNAEEGEVQSNLSSCNVASDFNIGFRPRCWFAPRLDL